MSSECKFADTLEGGRRRQALTHGLRRLGLGVVALVWLSAPAGADDWKLVSHDRGIEVYRRSVPGSDIVALKGIGTIDAPLWKVASILLDTKRAREWVDSLAESRVVRRLGENSYIEYNHIILPFIIKDRDFVSEVQIDVDPEQRSFGLTYRPTNDPGVPLTHNVRGEILAGRFQAVSLEKGRRTELTAEVQCDPKGWVPGWVVNLFQRNWPLTTFQAIRAQAAKADIAMPDGFEEVLRPTKEF